MSDNTNKMLDVLIIGMGFSGICAAIKLIQNNITNIQIHEKSDGIGGTWHDNIYQGQPVMFHHTFIAFHLNQTRIGQGVMQSKLK